MGREKAGRFIKQGSGKTQSGQKSIRAVGSGQVTKSTQRSSERDTAGRGQNKHSECSTREGGRSVEEKE